jgi:hypothetical protein
MAVAADGGDAARRQVRAAMATGGRSSETSGLAAPPLKKTMAARAPISNSSWTNNSPALAAWLCDTPLGDGIEEGDDSDDAEQGLRDGNVEDAGPIRTTRKRMASTTQRPATRRRRLARWSAFSLVQGSIAMAELCVICVNFRSPLRCDNSPQLNLELFAC